MKCSRIVSHNSVGENSSRTPKEETDLFCLPFSHSQHPNSTMALGNFTETRGGQRQRNATEMVERKRAGLGIFLEGAFGV